jgi:hypothetical protein
MVKLRSSEDPEDGKQAIFQMIAVKMSDSRFLCSNIEVDISIHLERCIGHSFCAIFN